MGIAHIDGTEGSCGPTCTGGFHACAEDCLTDPQECSYCVTLLCPAREMVEHHDGTVECEVAAGVCTALAHGWHQVTAVGGVLDLDEDLGGRACWDVAAERALAYACGPDCRIAPPGPSAEYIAHVAELMAGDAVHRAAAACSVCQ